MKLYLQILIIGLLIFNSKQLYSCSFGSVKGFYNAPIGAGGFCTNKGVCQGSFSETPNSPASIGTLTGDCFHCNAPNTFLDRGEQYSGVSCRTSCKEGYTDSDQGNSASSPLQANCQYCLSQLYNKKGNCRCVLKRNYLININDGECGTDCAIGYTHHSNGSAPDSPSTGHCIYCLNGFVKNNNVCECPKDQYLTSISGEKCGTSCVSGFTDQNNQSPASSPLEGNCIYCLRGLTVRKTDCVCYARGQFRGQYLTSSISETCGRKCDFGYTDQYDRSAPASPSTGNCIYCITGLINRNGVCECSDNTQYLTDINSRNCGSQCVYGYTDNSDRSLPNSPLSGHCIYCLTGLVKNNNVCQCDKNGYYLTSTISGTCGSSCAHGYTDQYDKSAPATHLTGHCIYCQTGFVNRNGACECSENNQYFTDNNNETCGTSCVPGFTDKSDRSNASVILTGNCQYCLAGLVNKNGACECSSPSLYLTNDINGACGRHCISGYTQHSNGSLADNPSTGHCLHCIKGLENNNGICECAIQGQYLTSISGGTCGTKCDIGFSQYENSDSVSPLFTHCFHCYRGLQNNNGVCECPNNTQYLTNIYSFTCGINCDSNFTHKSDGGAPDSPSTGHCVNCLSTHTYYNRKCIPKCPSGQYFIEFSPICGTTCVSGFTDQYDESPASSPLEGNCDKCLKGLYGNIDGCHCRTNGQYITSTISGKCGKACKYGYTHYSNGNKPARPSTGHCTYCLSATHKMYRGQCQKNCQLGQYYIQNDGTCGKSCANGYTDKADGSTPSANLRANCQYCLAGLVNRKGVCECRVKNQYLIDINSGTCGSQCAYGYTYNSNRLLPQLPISGHCLYCVYTLRNRNGFCQCPIRTQYLTDSETLRCGTECAIEYTYKTDGSAPDSPSTGHCLNCRAGIQDKHSYCHCDTDNGQYITNSTSNGTCGFNCDFGYTHNYDGSLPNSPTIEHCRYCLAGLKSKNGVCECATKGQYLTSTTSEQCGTTCAPGYTHNSNGSAPASNSTGHCRYCVSATHTLYKGQCYRKCPSGQYYTQNDGTCGRSCKIGYTDQLDRSTASSPLADNCQYCLNGLENINGVCQCTIPSQYLTSINSGICGKRCLNGYTYSQRGYRPSNPSQGHCLFCRSQYRLTKNGRCVKR